MKINSNSLTTTAQQSPDKLKNVDSDDRTDCCALVVLVIFYFTAI